MKSFKNGIALAVLGFAAISNQAMAAGYEKTVNWSGKWNGVGGAATAGVTGAESLYFNPAGLAEGKKSEVTGNFSPTFAKFTAPNPFAPTKEATGDQTFSPIFGALANYRVNDQLGVGAGIYVAGGAKAKFTDVNDVSFNDFENSLSLTEVSLGAGYKLMEGLRLGAAYRVSMVSANIVSGAVVSTTTKDLSGTSFDGYRIGLQYDQKTWGLGVSYRSNTKFTAKGTKTVVGTGATSNDYSLESNLPQSLSLGAYIDLMAGMRLYADASTTTYNTVHQITNDNGTITDSDLFWNNAVIYRGGLEYTGMAKWAYRLGYANTSQVVPADKANLVSSSPGVGSSFTLGVGHDCTDNLTVNLALAYEQTKGDSVAPATLGTYKSTAYAGHLGVSYFF